MLWLSHVKNQDQPQDVYQALALRETALRRLVAEAGESLDDILAPPKTDDATAAGFCPMCSYEYQDGVALCPDCGFPLEMFRERTPLAH
ncbi:MAG: zinc ribbon domain-containing protein [Candidatus Abyssobacteria bacterium SURF_5]|uniref:Zinc ribbon domain-containing protein n=1 Tax=Abyssobacteria bacterium (strain SURF_5) TaxID=2093360 RepID=A0A3A4N4S5_ABYX5|nr:MAG: zinc ribbon domain-containing protein [Candidatus Abyssubacteria bacterium SURF_5]